MSVRFGVVSVSNIEKSNNEINFMGYNLSFSFCLAIAFLYAFFVSYLFNKILGEQFANKSCYMLDKKEDIAACDAQVLAFNEKKFSFMIIIGVLSILVGTYAASSNPRYGVAGWGVSTGGLLLVIYYVIMNWWRLDTNLKLVILGSSLAGIIYGSTRFM